MSSKKYKVLGLMSGTSLDGLDIAFCEFEKLNDKWDFNIIHANTLEYPRKWNKLLKYAEKCKGEELVDYNIRYGKYLGEQSNKFLKENDLNCDLIASHGHTIFHNPQNHYTYQIGDGLAIAKEAKCTVVSDFRSQDIALGGQGAPLVPIGDKYLFSDYDICINIGGFSNISFEKDGERLAFDICPVNYILNYIAKKINMDFDNNGELAKSGNLNLDLYNDLKQYFIINDINNVNSLAREGVEKNIFPILNEFSELEINTQLYTITELVSDSIAAILEQLDGEKVLFTGGGTYNKFLIQLIEEKTSKNIIVPDDQLIEYKEALIFAFMGLLKYTGENNCLASATKAVRDHSSGKISNIFDN